jgi:sugar-phosphatase
MQTPLKGLLFDNDGVLVDSMPGANLELARARLSAAGIVAPQALVTADDGEKGKPDPEPYLLGAQKIGVPIAECVVFEDAPAGLVAGKLAGAALLVGIGEQTLDSVADVVIVSLVGLKYSFGLLAIPDEVRLR